MDEAPGGHACRRVENPAAFNLTPISVGTAAAQGIRDEAFQVGETLGRTPLGGGRGSAFGAGGGSDEGSSMERVARGERGSVETIAWTDFCMLGIIG